MNNETILEIKNLHTSFFTQYGEVRSVRGVNLNLKKGQVVGIVGESGCGKSVTARSIMKILQKPGKIVEGEIFFDGRNILELKERDFKKYRGSRLAMIFQDPMTALNPLLTIGYQLCEVIVQHNRTMRKADIKAKAVRLLTMVRIPEAEIRLKQYPHEFSGGMRQRIMIAMALANDPDILIADEPTTALDVTIQDQILTLMKELKDEKGKSIIMITHDLGVVAQICNYVFVMYAGEVVEEGNIYDIFEKPSHPYTVGLLNSLPSYRSQNDTSMLYSIPGSPPSLANEIKGCAFAPRCEKALKLCLTYKAELIDLGDGHYSRCHFCDKEISEQLGNFIEGGGDSEPKHS